MTFVEFKKMLLDADITLPKFAKLVAISEKNLQSYKKKDKVPNAIAALVASFVAMKKEGIDYKEVITNLNLEPKKKKGGGFNKKGNEKIIEKKSI